MKLASKTQNSTQRWVVHGEDQLRDVGSGIDWCRDEDLVVPVQEGWGAPISRSSKIICTGLNYHDHAEELGMESPELPTLFTRFPSSFTGHDQTMYYPVGSDQFDFEGELAIIIGRPAFQVDVSSALDHVFGYSVANDGSVRDFQFRTGQWASGKNFDLSAAIGPYIVSKDELPEGGSGLKIETRLNGATVQSSSTDQLIFPVSTLVSYISHCLTLHPGDAILTGTPAGVGMSRDPQLFMKPGDVCEVSIEGIGTLKNTIAQKV